MPASRIKIFLKTADLNDIASIANSTLPNEINDWLQAQSAIRVLNIQTTIDASSQNRFTLCITILYES